MDANKNGLNDEPTTAGLNGVVVELWNNATATLVTTTTTATLNTFPGYYKFEIANTGDYYVKFPLTNTTNGITVRDTTSATDNPKTFAKSL